jgi:putative membrane protein
MIEYDRYDWLGIVFSFRGTALRIVAMRMVAITLFAVVIQLIYEGGLLLGLKSRLFVFDAAEHAVLGSLLGFLIVFRMNASSNRYWEGRSLWGQIINSSRNLARAGAEYTTGGRELADLVSGYAIALRRSLQGNKDLLETEDFLPEPVRAQAATFGNPPTAIAAAITEWIARYHRLGQIDSQLVRHIEDQLSKLVDAQGGCEKIRKTPLPFAYVVMIKQLILVYLATLPIVVCDHCGWWTPVLVAIVALGLFGMEEVSVEIEDPFGTLENCLDMETFTLTIARDVGQLAGRKTGAPSAP